MKQLKYILLIWLCVSCVQDEEVRPESIFKIYPYHNLYIAEVSLSTAQVISLQQHDDNFLLFTDVQDGLYGYLSIIQTTNNGELIKQVAFDYDELLDGDSPLTIHLTRETEKIYEIFFTSEYTNYLVQFQVTNDSIAVINNEAFDTDGNVIGATKLDNDYYTLHRKYDEENDLVNMRVNLNGNLSNQQTIFEYSYSPLSELNLSVTSPFFSNPSFFVKKAQNKLLFGLPLEYDDEFTVSALFRENANGYDTLYTGSMLIADMQFNSLTGLYDILFYDVFYGNAFLMENFDISKSEKQYADENGYSYGEIEANYRSYVKTGNLLWQTETCLEEQNNGTYLCHQDYTPFDDININHSMFIRYDNQGKVYIAGTNLIGQAVIYHNQKAYTFGSGSPKYILDDVLITDDKMVIAGNTSLNLENKPVTENGDGNTSNHPLKRTPVPFMLIVPLSDFK